MTKSLAGGHTAHGKEQSWEFIPIPSVAGTAIFFDCSPTLCSWFPNTRSGLLTGTVARSGWLWLCMCVKGEQEGIMVLFRVPGLCPRVWGGRLDWLIVLEPQVFTASLVEPLLLLGPLPWGAARSWGWRRFLRPAWWLQCVISWGWLCLSPPGMLPLDCGPQKSLPFLTTLGVCSS